MNKCIPLHSLKKTRDIGGGKSGEVIGDALILLKKRKKKLFIRYRLKL
jgi:hypothetical protein